MKVLENSAKIAEIQSRLNKYSYLSKTSLPGYADGRVFLHLQAAKKFPDRSTNPNFYHWYILLKQFSSSTINKWVTDQLYYDQDDTLIGEFTKTQIKREQVEILQETRHRVDNINEFQYTIDIYISNLIEEKIKALEKILEEYRAEPIQILEGEKSKLVRVICRMDTTKNEEMKSKIDAAIEYENMEVKKKSLKANASNTVEKNANE